MSLRISKTIGCYISQGDSPDIFVRNYKSILNKLYDDEEGIEQFFKTIQELLKEQGKLMESMYGPELRQMGAVVKSGKVQLYQLISSVYDGDNFQGLMFCTEHQVQESRRDSDIDYYEADDLDFHINLLHAPIYPCSGYMYRGGLKEDFPSLESGKTLSGLELRTIIHKLNQKFFDGKLNITQKKDVAKILSHTGHFHPVVDGRYYFMAKAAGILKKNVTMDEFLWKLEPAIVTSWS